MVHFLFLLIAPLLAGANPLPTPFPHFEPRNHAGPPENYTTPGDPVAATGTPVTASASAASASSTSPVLLLDGISANLLSYVAIAIVVCCVFCVLIARYFYIKRFYPPTLRSYFLPAKGIHLLCLHIAGPPPRPAPPPLVRIVRRPGRTTVGPGISAGGRRDGERDEDDLLDGDDSELVEMREGAGRVAGGGEREALPIYAVDHDLPRYAFDGPTGMERTLGGVGALPGEEGEALPSVQAYEEASRTNGTNGTAVPSATLFASVSAGGGNHQEEEASPRASTSASTLSTGTTESESTLAKVDLDDDVAPDKEKEIGREADVGDQVISGGEGDTADGCDEEKDAGRKDSEFDHPL